MDRSLQFQCSREMLPEYQLISEYKLQTTVHLINIETYTTETQTLLRFSHIIEHSFHCIQVAIRDGSMSFCNN